MPAKKKTPTAKKKFSAAQIAAQRAFAERNRGRKGRAGGGGDTIRPDRKGGDKTPHRADPAPLGAAFQLRIDTVPVLRTQPADLMAMGAALLFALRSINLGLLDKDQAEVQQILAGWFDDASQSGTLPNGTDLSAEVKFFHELFRALPEVAKRMSFAGEEWIAAYNAIIGPTMGVLPVGPPTAAGLDGMYPPLRGTVEMPFSPPTSLGVSISAPAGTSVIAPEDFMVTAIKTEPGGMRVIAVSRRPTDGEYPPVISGGGPISALLPVEGLRRHILTGLGTTAAGLKRGDKVERGQAIGSVGGGGRSEWRVDIYVADSDGKVKLTPMDPQDLVPLDVLAGGAAVRPPSPTWTVVNPKKPSETVEKPSYNIWIGGDLIHNGGKIETGDIDVLSLPVGAKMGGESEFAKMDTIERFARGAARGLGTGVGALYGGPLGAKVGGQAGEALAGFGADLLTGALRQ